MDIQWFWKNACFLVVTLFLGICTVEAARFIDNKDGTVNDNTTGLMWQQTNDIDYVQWLQANNYCEYLQLGGHNDWRLPDKNELFGIFDKSYYGKNRIAIDPAFNLIGHNPNTRNYYAFWTSTKYPDSKFQLLQPKYIVIFGMFLEDFLGINNDVINDDHKNEVLCVRNGPLQINNFATRHSRGQNTTIAQTKQKPTKSFTVPKTSKQIPAAVRTKKKPVAVFTDIETSRQIPLTFQPNQKPKAVFSASKNSAQKPVTVALDASGSFDLDGSITSYNWISSDGQKATGRKANFIFDKGGNVTISLMVTDNKGSTDSAIQLLVTDLPNRKPTSFFTASTTTGTASLEVLFDASRSLDHDGSISSYSWTSSDGQNAMGKKASMTFDTAGKHNVTLTVRDDRGAESTYITTIVVLRDVTPPSVSIQFPLSGTTLTGNVLIAAEIEDETPIKSVEVFVDEYLFGNMEQTDSGTWEFVLNTASLPNNSHKLVARVVSNAGIIGENSIQFNSMNEDLLATIFSPRDNDTVEGTVEVDLYVGDETKLSAAVLYVDDRPFGRRMKGGPWNFHLPTTRLDNGFHTLAVKLITHDGQIEWTQELSIETLNEPEEPDIEVSILSPQEGRVRGVHFEVKATASTDEIVTFVTLYLDNDILLETQEYNSYQSDFTFDVDLSNYSNGKHTLSIYLETNTGSIGFTDPVTFTLDSKYVYMQENPPEIYSFRADVKSGDAPLEVSFKCQANDHDGRIKDFIWNFGDDSELKTTSSGSVMHTYYEPGTYRTTCTVVDDVGLEDVSDPVKITVANEAIPELPDIYSFNADVKSGDVPLRVYFTCKTNNQDVTIIEYIWDFGDDSEERTTVSSATTTHTYHNAGIYQATCTVVDENGVEVVSDSINITVERTVANPLIGSKLTMAYCATINEQTGQLHIPCVATGSVNANETQTYEMNFSAVSQSGLIFELEDFSQVKVSNNNQCAFFDSILERLYIPCFDDGTLYRASCKLIPSDNLRIEIQKWKNKEVLNLDRNSNPLVPIMLKN